jgi:hypothetical protein
MLAQGAASTEWRVLLDKPAMFDAGQSIARTPCTAAYLTYPNDTVSNKITCD